MAALRLKLDRGQEGPRGYQGGPAPNRPGAHSPNAKALDTFLTRLTDRSVRQASDTRLRGQAPETGKFVCTFHSLEPQLFLGFAPCGVKSTQVQKS